MSIKSIRERAEAAKNGPWEWVVDSGDVHLTSGGEVSEGHVLTVYICSACFEREWPCMGGLPGDQTFIAHARTDVPALLRVAEAARVLMAHEVDYFPGSDVPYFVYTGADKDGWAALRAALADLEALP